MVCYREGRLDQLWAETALNGRPARPIPLRGEWMIADASIGL